MIDHPFFLFSVSVSVLVLQFVSVRHLVNSAIDYQERRVFRNRRRIEKQHVKEWFLYTHYRDMLPHLLLKLYWAGMMYICASFLLALFFFITANSEKSRIVMNATILIWFCKGVLRVCLEIPGDEGAKRRPAVRLIFYLDKKIERRRKRKKN